MDIRACLKAISVSLFLWVVSGCSQESAQANSESDAAWLTDYKAAVAQAKKENKVLLLDFTGSDWCPPCMLLKKRVFNSAAFKEFAQKNLVLVEVDFPKGKPQSPALVAQNEKLVSQYGAGEAFPTVVLANAQEQILGGMVGYDQSPPEQYIAQLQRILKEKPALKGR